MLAEVAIQRLGIAKCFATFTARVDFGAGFSFHRDLGNFYALLRIDLLRFDIVFIHIDINVVIGNGRLRVSIKISGVIIISWSISPKAITPLSSR